jgi:hypothetical protein
LDEDYISLTDMARYRDAGRVNYIIQDWTSTHNTIEYLGLWEQLDNPEFKSIEFDAFRNQVGLNNFALTPELWVEKTAAVGIIALFISVSCRQQETGVTRVGRQKGGGP